MTKRGVNCEYNFKTLKYTYIVTTFDGSMSNNFFDLGAHTDRGIERQTDEQKRLSIEAELEYICLIRLQEPSSDFNDKDNTP